MTKPLALGAALVAAGVLLLVTVPAGGGATAVVGSNIVINEAGPVDANNSPVAARNPVDPKNVVVAHRVDRPRYGAHLQTSADGGTTWSATALPLPEGRDRPYEPDVAFAPDGTLYVLYVNLRGRGNDPETLWLASSDDGGRSLSTPVEVAGELAFQGRVVVDGQGVVHVVWMQADSVGTLSVRGSTHIVAARSDDGGRTFTRPVPVSDDGRPRVGAAVPVVDGDGRLVVVYQDFKDDRRDFENLPGPAWDGRFALVLTRSDDGGRTFAAGAEIESDIVVLRRFLVYLPPTPSVAVGPEGRLYVAWTDGRSGDEDVLLRRSDDGGRTWRRPVRVGPRGRSDGDAQFLPSVDVGADGRVDVVFLHRDDDGASRSTTHAALATSTDRARSFTILRLSSEAFDARIGPVTAPHLGVDLGSRVAVSSTAEGTLAAWPDTRIGTRDSGRQDIAAAVVTFSPSGGDAVGRRAIVITAGSIGALALCGGIVFGRRRDRPAGTGADGAGPE